MLRALPQVQSMEAAKKFLGFANTQDLEQLKNMIAAGFDDLDSMHSVYVHQLTLITIKCLNIC